MLWFLMLVVPVVVDFLVAAGIGFRLYVLTVHDDWRMGVNDLLFGSQNRMDKGRENFGRLWDWRAKYEVGMNPIFLVSALVIFVATSLLTPWLFMSGFAMKAEVAREVFTGSIGVKSWTLDLGVMVFPVTIVNVVAAGMVASEMLLGVVFHYSGERIFRQKGGEADGETIVFKFLWFGSMAGIVALVGLEGVMGVFRAQIETQGKMELLPTIFMVGTSMILSTATVVVAYIWKSNLGSLLLPIRWALMVVAWGFNALWLGVAGLWWIFVRFLVFQGYIAAVLFATRDNKLDEEEAPQPTSEPSPESPPSA